MQKHALQLACTPIPMVRIGFIGLGNRGQKTLERYLHIDGVQIVALCDYLEDNISQSISILKDFTNVLPQRYSGESAWQTVCELPNVDLVFICTDWLSHADIACHAMRCGKHVALEVPAAMTVADCWRLVDTAEQTQRHCMMVENCCYDPFNLLALHLSQNGTLGEITHAEGAYIHDLRNEYARNGWMKRYNVAHTGNFYPTHGLGPACQQMNIHRGDRLDTLVSLSATALHADMPGISNTLIRTAKGRTILLQYDVVTPRPYSRVQITCGTKGYVQKYPVPTLMLDGWDEPLTGAKLETEMPRFEHPLTRTLGTEACQKGITNEMNYLMDRRLIHCLHHGLPLDQDVYDAAEWSCITELSEQSVRQGGAPVQIPDFTRGRWQVLKKFTLAE